MIQLTVEAVSFKDPIEFTYKKGKQQGQKGKLYKAAIKSDDKWYDGTFFTEEELKPLKSLNKGDKISVVTFQEEYNGKTYDKFKFPNKEDQQQQEITELKKEVETIKQVIKDLMTVNNLRVK